MSRVVLAICVAATQAAAQPAVSRVSEARLSPDGQWIAFARQSGDTPLGVFRITFGGQDEIRVAPPDGVISGIRWSPASDAIVYQSRPSAGAPARLLSVPAGGGTPRPIGPAAPPPATPTLPATAAIITVPGAKILFVTPVAGDQQALTLTNGNETWIDLVNPSGARLTVMPPGIARIAAAPSWSDDGRRFAVVATTADGAVEIFGGLLPRPQPTGANVGAMPPPVRQLTGVPR